VVLLGHLRRVLALEKRLFHATGPLRRSHTPASLRLTKCQPPKHQRNQPVSSIMPGRRTATGFSSWQSPRELEFATHTHCTHSGQ
jgi:hypothetical protein